MLAISVCMYIGCSQMLFIGEAAQIFNSTDKSMMKVPKKGL